MEKLNEIVELGKAQDLILGEKEIGEGDGGVHPFRLGEPNGEEDE